jgi:23S rRNA pseudouridine2605 synthase
MRINKFIAAATGLSRRAADQAISDGRVLVNGGRPQAGQPVSDNDNVTIDGRKLGQPSITQTILFNKPAGYVVSRDGQGSQTIYNLLPANLHHLKPAGRLDKDSSGLLLLTNDGQLAQTLTHPRYQKTKIYQVELDKPLTEEAKTALRQGVPLEDGTSHLEVREWTIDVREQNPDVQRLPPNVYKVSMQEGRNRQIRRTFAALGYTVTKLHRTHFGAYDLGELPPGQYQAG